MGDGADHADIEHLLTSSLGKAHLASTADALAGRTIARVSFENRTDHVQTVLHLDDGSIWKAAEQQHDIGYLRAHFPELLEHACGEVRHE